MASIPSVIPILCIAALILTTSTTTAVAINHPDIDECALGIANCGDDVCINTNGSYHCGSCGIGYLIDVQTSVCVDIDECSQDNLNNCDGLCLNTEGSYFCANCGSGYVLNLETPACVDIDECALGIHDCGGDVCFNTHGSYHCGSCGIGYLLNVVSSQCEDVNECGPEFDLCDGKCTNTDGSYTCTCYSGYYLADGGSCYDINECYIADVCSDDKTCVNTPGWYYCR